MKKKELKEALLTYGRHLVECNQHHCWHNEHNRNCCDCGWTRIEFELRRKSLDKK